MGRPVVAVVFSLQFLFFALRKWKRGRYWFISRAPPGLTVIMCCFVLLLCFFFYIVNLLGFFI